MPDYRAEFVVAGDRAEIFKYLIDFSNAEEWDPGVNAAARVDDGELGVGSQFDLECQFGKSRVDLRYRIVELMADTKVVFEAENNKVRSLDTLSFADAGDGKTRVTYQAELSMKGLSKLATPYVASKFDEIGEAAEQSLSETLERHFGGGE